MSPSVVKGGGGRAGSRWVFEGNKERAGRKKARTRMGKAKGGFPGATCQRKEEVETELRVRIGMGWWVLLTSSLRTEARRLTPGSTLVV